MCVWDGRIFLVFFTHFSPGKTLRANFYFYNHSLASVTTCRRQKTTTMTWQVSQKLKTSRKMLQKLIN